MKIRLMGLHAECEAMVFILRKMEKHGEFEIRNVSDWYANRPPSKEGRVYVEIE